jgi:hypothetical protein
MLGISPNKSGAIFVEDRAAREYAKCWLGNFSPNLLHEYEIVDVSSVENILQQLRFFPALGRWFKVIGLFDGDQRGKIVENLKWPHSFLPGNEAPEKYILSLAKVKRQELAAALGRDSSKINLSLAALDGVDHHDWIIEFPKLIGIGYEQFISYMFSLSMTDENLRAEAENAFNELREILCSDAN